MRTSCAAHARHGGGPLPHHGGRRRAWGARRGVALGREVRRSPRPGVGEGLSDGETAVLTSSAATIPESSTRAALASLWRSWRIRPLGRCVRVLALEVSWRLSNSTQLEPLQAALLVLTPECIVVEAVEAGVGFLHRFREPRFFKEVLDDVPKTFLLRQLHHQPQLLPDLLEQLEQPHLLLVQLVVFLLQGFDLVVLLLELGLQLLDVGFDEAEPRQFVHLRLGHSRHRNLCRSSFYRNFGPPRAALKSQYSVQVGLELLGQFLGSF
mmetsp:Transcript_67506/g.121674  ORF Transcript_67506/g.121674 Transcript_67506/m.121674 type:complete len:267 (-) Transcript_67506:666-1466(-)